MPEIILHNMSVEMASGVVASLDGLSWSGHIAVSHVSTPPEPEKSNWLISSQPQRELGLDLSPFAKVWSDEQGVEPIELLKTVLTVLQICDLSYDFCNAREFISVPELFWTGFNATFPMLIEALHPSDATFDPDELRKLTGEINEGLTWTVNKTRDAFDFCSLVSTSIDQNALSSFLKGTSTERRDLGSVLVPGERSEYATVRSDESWVECIQQIQRLADYLLG